MLIVFTGVQRSVRWYITYFVGQVCSHIVSAIHREAIKIKNEFDSYITRSVLELTNDNIRLVFEGEIWEYYCLLFQCDNITFYLLIFQTNPRFWTDIASKCCLWSWPLLGAKLEDLICRSKAIWFKISCNCCTLELHEYKDKYELLNIATFVLFAKNF